MKARVTLAAGNIVRETEKAVAFDFGRGVVWLPKSQIELERPTDNISVSGSLVMPIWLAKRAGLWGYDDFGGTVCQLIEG